MSSSDARKKFRIRKTVEIDVVLVADCDGEFYGEELHPVDLGYVSVERLRDEGYSVEEVLPPPPPPIPDGTVRRFTDSGNVVVKKWGVWYYVTSRGGNDAIGTSEIGGHNSFSDESLFDDFEWVQL